MEQKKPGIPLVALIIFFVLIIGIIVTCLIILSSRPSESGNSIRLYNTTNEAENAVVNNIEEEPVVEDTGTEVPLTDESVINAYKLAGNYDVAAKFAIYQNGDFTTDSLNEILKLKIAFAQLSDEELNAGSITKARVEECLTQVFGTAEGVNMQTVTMFDDYNFKTEYDIASFDYDQQTETFTVNKQQLQITDPSLVTEIVNKAVSYSDRLEIYVTPIYAQVTDTTLDGANVTVYSLYSGYDYTNQSFTDLLIAVRKEDYYNAFVSGDTLDIDGFNYDNLSTNIMNNRADRLDIATLQQYKYTFTKNGDNYVLSSFERVVPEEETTPDTSENTPDATNTSTETNTSSTETTEGTDGTDSSEANTTE